MKRSKRIKSEKPSKRIKSKKRNQRINTKKSKRRDGMGKDDDLVLPVNYSDVSNKLNLNSIKEFLQYCVREIDNVEIIFTFIPLKDNNILTEIYKGLEFTEKAKEDISESIFGETSKYTNIMCHTHPKNTILGERKNNPPSATDYEISYYQYYQYNIRYNFVFSDEGVYFYYPTKKIIEIEDLTRYMYFDYHIVPVEIMEGFNEYQFNPLDTLHFNCVNNLISIEEYLKNINDEGFFYCEYRKWDDNLIFDVPISEEDYEICEIYQLERTNKEIPRVLLSDDVPYDHNYFFLTNDNKLKTQIKKCDFGKLFK
jgi:hypothetical protein